MRNGLNDVRGQRRAEKKFYQRQDQLRKRKEKAAKAKAESQDLQETK